jgi:hypothetical protein
MKCLQSSGGDVNACAQLQETLQQCKWQNGE